MDARCFCVRVRLIIIIVVNGIRYKYTATVNVSVCEKRACERGRAEKVNDHETNAKIFKNCIIRFNLNRRWRHWPRRRVISDRRRRSINRPCPRYPLFVAITYYYLEPWTKRGHQLRARLQTMKTIFQFRVWLILGVHQLWNTRRFYHTCPDACLGISEYTEMTHVKIPIESSSTL